MLSGVGSGGYSWASTVNSTFGMGLDFYATALRSSSSNHHGYGFQLRCLSE